MKKVNEEKKPKELLFNSILQKETKVFSLIIDWIAMRKKLLTKERKIFENEQNKGIAAHG